MYLWKWPNRLGNQANAHATTVSLTRAKCLVAAPSCFIFSQVAQNVTSPPAYSLMGGRGGWGEGNPISPPSQQTNEKKALVQLMVEMPPHCNRHHTQNEPHARVWCLCTAYRSHVSDSKTCPSLLLCYVTCSLVRLQRAVCQCVVICLGGWCSRESEGMGVATQSRGGNTCIYNAIKCNCCAINASLFTLC